MRGTFFVVQFKRQVSLSALHLYDVGAGRGFVGRRTRAAVASGGDSSGYSSRNSTVAGGGRRPGAAGEGNRATSGGV